MLLAMEFCAKNCSIDTLPASLTILVLIKPYCSGGIRSSEGQMA